MGFILWLLEKFTPHLARFELFFKLLFDLFILTVFIMILVTAKPTYVYLCIPNITSLNTSVFNFTNLSVLNATV